MAKIQCYVCKELRSPAYTVKDYWRSPQTPEGMTNTDHVCYECYQKVKKEVIQYKKEHKEEIDRLNKEEDLELKKIENEFKGKWNKNGVIEYKDEYCAILQRLPGARVQFLKAYSDLTREGYRLMAQDEGGSINAGIISAGVNAYFYFQKIEYVTLSDNTKQ